MPADHDLRQALIDVRKAYRLIWLYQRRAVDIIKLINKAFGHKFYVWETEDSIGKMPGQKTTDPFGDNKWIWSTLPLYRMSLLYLPPSLEPNRQIMGEWMCEIFVETDTGFSENEDETEPAPANFTPADESNTFLRLYAWYCTQDGTLNWFDGIWNEMDGPEQDDEVTAEHPNVPIKILRKSFELSKLNDEPSVERAIGEFKSALSQHFEVIFSGSPPSNDPEPSSIRLRG